MSSQSAAVGRRKQGVLREELKRLPKATGKWLGNGVFQMSDRRIGFARSYLEATVDSIHWRMWYEWIIVLCPDLDPNVNGGKIRAFRVPAPKKPWPAGNLR